MEQQSCGFRCRIIVMELNFGVLVRDISKEASQQSFKSYFTAFKDVLEAASPKDNTGYYWGSGLLTFDSEAPIDVILAVKEDDVSVCVGF